MKVTINGAVTDMPDTATVIDALTVAGQQGPALGVAVALNGEVVVRGAWPGTHLSEGDRVEVLVAAQGG